MLRRVRNTSDISQGIRQKRVTGRWCDLILPESRSPNQSRSIIDVHLAVRLGIEALHDDGAAMRNVAVRTNVSSSEANDVDTVRKAQRLAGQIFRAGQRRSIAADGWWPVVAARCLPIRSSGAYAGFRARRVGISSVARRWSFPMRPIDAGSTLRPEIARRGSLSSVRDEMFDRTPHCETMRKSFDYCESQRASTSML